MSPLPLETTLQMLFAELPAGKIAVAFSGGIDSSVLLHALAQMPAARTRGLRALHVDHGLHADSKRWVEHCAGFVRELGIALDVDSVVVEHATGTGLEDAARAARFAAFARRLGPGETLALAQHRDDQAETILLKLLRGAGPEGLGGMRTLRQFAEGYLWRPLLGLPRSAVLGYAQAHGLHWIDDPSNAHTHLRRNFLRQEILPRLKQRWPDAAAALAHSATWARAAADFIGDQSRLALARLQGADAATLRWHDWLGLPDALRDPVLRLWLRELRLDEPAHFHIAELERQLHAAQDRAPCVTFAQTQVRRYRDLLYAMRAQPPIPEGWETTWSGAPLDLPGGGRLTLASGNSSDLALRVRYRRGGERFKPAGCAHTRELRSLLQESGIPPWQRERIPLIYAGAYLLAAGDLFLSTFGRQWCASHDVRIVWEQGLRAEG
jgi:tRNA(Ile)-lysidine synthase